MSLNIPTSNSTLELFRRDGDCITAPHLIRLGQEGWCLTGARRNKIEDTQGFVFERQAPKYGEDQ